MRTVSKYWNARTLVYAGLLFICCGVTVPIVGCQDWSGWAKDNPAKAAEIAERIAAEPEALPPMPTTPPVVEAIDNAERYIQAAQPLIDATAPATGGISALIALIVTQSLSGIRLIATEIERTRLRKAILALHNAPVSNERGVAGLVSDPAAKLTLAKVTGDLHPL